MTTPPLQIADDVKEAASKECSEHLNRAAAKAKYSQPLIQPLGHHVQTLLNARLKERDDLFKQSDIERRAFITDLESIIEGLRRELLSQALTMRADINRACVSFEAIVEESKKLQPGNVAHLSAQIACIASGRKLLLEQGLLTAPPSDTLREVVQKVERIKLELNSWYGANHPYPKHIDAALSLCGEILKYLSTESKP